MEETKKVMSDKIARLKAELDDANLATMQSQVAEDAEDDSEQMNTREEDDSDYVTSGEEDETSTAESEQKSYDLLVCDNPDASPPQVMSKALYPPVRDLREASARLGAVSRSSCQPRVISIRSGVLCVKLAARLRFPPVADRLFPERPRSTHHATYLWPSTGLLDEANLGSVPAVQAHHGVQRIL